MPDKEIRHPEDASVVSLDHRWEVAYWTRELGVGEEQLREVIERVGNSVENVRRYIEMIGGQ